MALRNATSTGSDLATIAKKHGATGVLSVWVLILQLQMGLVQNKLFECYTGKTPAESVTTTTKSVNKPPEFQAVIPRKTKIKKYHYEKNS